MMNFTSPPSNDPIKKIQNLLNNSLHSIMDVVSNLSYKGEPKELVLEKYNVSDYSYFTNLLKEEENKDKRDLIDNIEDEKKLIIKNNEEENNYFIKPYFEEPLKNEILDRVERMNLILNMIDESIDDLPDSIMNEEEKCEEIKKLQRKKDEAKEELKTLYKEYDDLYNYVTDHLRYYAINMK
ncbi:large ribosomal subunit processing factor, putative [Plasmodium reichenowi]|uniref:Large ribosomal subunit processing factor, putative n=1 Tax=Plasmodium reichenowi TaxID=5854 RepID=A0A060RUC9_PLARE|nr:large ribosomal subunit processing factor, putative [Plasmodium reichenowi]KYN96599.1 large ribosomal subunit processing factor, putative [Plasmodium reichenowi]CDO65068.1 large ribosomal subunit processing factor, putative [Plasmodium reichenowi]SOV80195.1 large ribosomal subunit processing factor, putative [Plasmodium reichenowi]